MFDGTEYPYWKNKMRMHLEAIDVDLWYVVKNGVPKAGEGVNKLSSDLSSVLTTSCLVISVAPRA